MQRQGKERSGPDRGSLSLMSFYKYINIRKQGQTISKKKFLKQVPRTGRCLFKPCGSNGCFYDVSTDGHLIQNGPVIKSHTSVTWIGSEIDMWPKPNQSESFTGLCFFSNLSWGKRIFPFQPCNCQYVRLELQQQWPSHMRSQSKQASWPSKKLRQAIKSWNPHNVQVPGSSCP